MKNLRLLTIALLFFNGLSGIAGGVALITDPSGNVIAMPVSMLAYSPFTNFLIPGLLLFTLNGLSSLLIAWATIRKKAKYPLLITGQGITSLIWIVTQVFMIRAVVSLHYIYGGTGLVLLLMGIALWNAQYNERNVEK